MLTGLKTFCTMSAIIAGLGLQSAAMAAPTVAASAQMAPAATEKSATLDHAAAGRTDYRLGPADKIKLTVFGEDNLSGEYILSPSGKLALPLLGDLDASGLTVGELKDMVEAKYRNGFLKNPNVSVQILTLRPFYILGEVNKPGEYPYSADLTIQKAAATAGGFTYRANTRRVFIKHIGDTVEAAYTIDSSTPVMPGDTIRIVERFF